MIKYLLIVKYSKKYLKIYVTFIRFKFCFKFGYQFIEYFKDEKYTNQQLIKCCNLCNIFIELLGWHSFIFLYTI